MGVSGVGGTTALSLNAITDMRRQLDDLQRQLGTGKKSDSYAGLGLDRGLAIGLRSHLSAITGYQGTITQVGARLDLMQTALTQFDSLSQKTKSTILQSQYALHGGVQTQDQINVKGTLDSLLGMLNSSADGRYLFSGRAVDQTPVETADHILNGDGLKADLGTAGLGRLVIGSPAANATSLTDDASPFGIKLAGLTTNIAGAIVTPPGAPPATMSIALASVPSSGDTVKFTFTLPDGSSRDLALTATSSASPGAGEFTIGGTTTATAASLQTALAASLATFANTELVAASAVAAGNDFFNTDASNPPQRVDGPPFDSATALVDGSATTVAWYGGDNATDDPRGTAIARADQSLTVA